MAVYMYMCEVFRGCYVQASRPREVSSLQRVLCTGFSGVGPEDVSLLERCPHFRGCCVQASVEWDLKMCPY